MSAAATPANGTLPTHVPSTLMIGAPDYSRHFCGSCGFVVTRASKYHMLCPNSKCTARDWKHIGIAYPINSDEITLVQIYALLRDNPYLAFAGLFEVVETKTTNKTTTDRLFRTIDQFPASRLSLGYAAYRIGLRRFAGVRS